MGPAAILTSPGARAKPPTAPQGPQFKGLNASQQDRNAGIRPLTDRSDRFQTITSLVQSILRPTPWPLSMTG